MIFLRVKESAEIRIKDGVISVSTQDGVVDFSSPGKALETEISKLKTGGVSEATLFSRARQTGPGAVNFARGFLDELIRGQLLTYVLRDSGRVRAILEPTSRTFSFGPVSWSQSAGYRLRSRAYFRRIDNQLVLEASDGCARVRFPSTERIGGQLAGLLTEFRTTGELLKTLSVSDQVTLRNLLAILKNASAIRTEGSPNNENEALWVFHDNLFHWKTRLGRTDGPYGSRPSSTSEPTDYPAFKPRGNGEIIDLSEPNSNAELAEKSFFEVLQQRRTLRQHGIPPISLQELSRFLYRSVRVQDTFESNGRTLTKRPYPAGGGLHEIEIYPIVYHCQNLESGLYHYRPNTHELEHKSEIESSTKALLEGARLATGKRKLPQILLVLSARMGRISQKYDAIPYSLILKHVGVMMQTFYLVATHLDLAPCAVGGGNSEDFRKATNFDPNRETSVGEFILGRRGNKPE